MWTTPVTDYMTCNLKCVNYPSISSRSRWKETKHKRSRHSNLTRTHIDNSHHGEKIFLTSACWWYIQVCLTVCTSNFLLSQNTRLTIATSSPGGRVCLVLLPGPLSVSGCGSASVSLWCWAGHRRLPVGPNASGSRGIWPLRTAAPWNPART